MKPTRSPMRAFDRLPTLTAVRRFAGGGTSWILAWIVLAAASTPALARDWLLVDTAGQTLTLMQDTVAALVYENVSIGQDGATRSKVTQDGRTPMGAYRISEIRDSERFHRFIAIDYPSLDDALRAVKDGRIDEAALERIRRAHEYGLQPPADTPLGGHIGIHGIGNGDPRFHEEFNWTDGCIALTDEQIDELIPKLKPGMTILIR